MKSLAKRCRSITLTSLALLTLLALPGLAQSQDLSGTWSLQTKAGEIRVELKEVGNSWHGKGLSETPLHLKLNPAGLRNQWMGDLDYQGKHGVKAEIKGGDTLLLTDLQSQENWSLVRSK